MQANRFLIYLIDESNEMNGRLFTQRIKWVEGIGGLGDWVQWYTFVFVLNIHSDNIERMQKIKNKTATNTSGFTVIPLLRDETHSEIHNFWNHRHIICLRLKHRFATSTNEEWNLASLPNVSFIKSDNWQRKTLEAVFLTPPWADTRIFIKSIQSFFF